MLDQLRGNTRLESKVCTRFPRTSSKLTFGQVTRVLRALTEPPPSLSLESFVSQIGAEISAEEKLEAAKLQESMKPIYDRPRRIVS